ncbi:MAG: PAS domain S-box protein, partial [Verrucomicrobia bacterium]|nr:PAS domain S-box protein [Verrucomicrobiota bacterium]
MKAVESTSDAVEISDVQARHFYQNRAFSELFGYATAEELQAAGGGPTIIKDPEVAREMFANIQSGKPWTGELEMVTRSGHVFPAYERAHPIKDEAGNLIGLVGIITDFSARKRDEDALRLFKNLVQHSSDAIGMSTPEGKHYYQNSAFDRLFGKVEDRRPETMYVNPEIGKQVFDTIMGGGSWEGEVQMFKHDRTILTIFLRAYPIKGPTGQLLSLIGLHNAIISTDTTGRLLDCNLAAAVMYGYPDKTALLARSLKDLSPERQLGGRYSHEVIAERTVELLARGSARFEWLHQRADSTTFLCDISIKLVEVRGQQLWIGIARDISQSKQAEQALRESEAKYRLLFDSAGDGIFIHDLAGRILAANRFSQTQLGYTLEELLSMTVTQLDSPEERQQEPQRIAKLLQQGHLTFETVHQRKDGSLFPLEASTQRIVWEGQPAILSITRDLTERREAETQLRKLQSVVEQTPVVVVITDPQGVIEYVNPSFVSQTGYSLAEAIGQKPSVIKSGLTSAEVYAELWRTLMAGQTWRGELCNRRKDGSLFWEIAVIAPLRDSAGRLTHFVAVKEDITEHRRIAEELRLAKESADAANRAKSTFLANMSHEIRTPMNAILGFAQLMRRDAGLTPSQRQRLDTINRSGEHLIRLISDILDMAKIESGQMQLVLENCDFLVLLADVEAIFRSRIEERRLRFQVQHAPNLPSHLYTDGGKVRQVIYNVLGNAVKFTVQGGIRVRVSAEPAPPTDEGQQTARVCIEMTDTGPGIAEEESDQVFVAFEQTAGGHHQGGGTGLGLAISQRLARELGGDLTLTSQVGAGST